MPPCHAVFTRRALAPVLIGLAQLVRARVAAAANDTAFAPMVHQLRIYEIFEHNKAAFHARFRDHAARIMARHGFHIVAMWEARADARTEFVYLLQWPDEATLKARWADFMADGEWIAIKERTAAGGAMVGGIQDRVLHPTDYSPPL
ncbi:MULTISPECIES: NIPSNAP family protein [unclassified Bradyrhizobium]|uniref:NIPSNAP family protein n=1 Tax=unclassified Bradyrhizobium TaxID=2631580 RepID=UPI00201337B3|nr:MULTISPECIES: NIPSNAP family protein [unclassified Bradyrhizobium]